jgi:DNA-binding NarL/FixJ family response regulator
MELLDALVHDGALKQDASLVEVAPGATLPVSLSAAIGRRLGYLRPEVRTLVQMAATLDTRFSMAELVSISGRPVPVVAELVGEAVQARVLTEAGTQLTFRHPLIRQLQYEQVPHAVRIGLHEHAARTLAHAGASWDRVARHLLAAPQAIDGWAIDWLTHLSGPALLALPAVASDLLTQARTALRADDPRRDVITIRLASALRMLSRVDDLIALAPALVRVTDPAQAGEFAWHLARGYQMSPARGREGITLIDDFLHRIDPGPPWRSRLLAQRAILIANAGHASDTVDVIAHAVEAGERDGDPISVGYALNAHLQIGNPTQNIDTIDRALALPWTDDPEAIDLRMLLMANRLIALLNLERWNDVEQALPVSLAEADRLHSPRSAELHHTAMIYYFLRPDWDQALLHAALTEPRTDYLALLVHGHAARIHARRGESELAREHIAAVGHIPYRAEMSNMIAARSLMLAEATLAEAEGDLAAAIEILSAWIGPEFGANGHARHVRGFNVATLTRLAIANGDWDLARSAAMLLQADEAADPDDPSTSGYSQLAQGMVDADPGHIRLALNYYEATDQVLEAIWAAEELAAALANRGDFDAARQAFHRAADGYETIGAATDLRRLNSRLRPHGIRRGARTAHRRATHGWAALTTTERTITQLVADGRTNAEVAARLYISRRTVETHVTHILRKLQLKSRIDISLTQPMTDRPTTSNPPPWRRHRT